MLTFLVPIGQQRASEVHTLSIPALRDHVDLFADNFFISLFGMEGIGNVEHADRAVHEGVDEERGVVGAEANIDRQWNL